jgi:EF-hand domain-containing protein 1
VESRLENHRIRKVIVFFFLEDHTVMISEPREVNSGVPQGNFLKRSMLLKEDGSGLPLLPFDFRVGEDVVILGRHFRLYDCDDYTRDFFKTHKKPQGPATKAPMDCFAETKIEKPKFRDTELKEFMEK